MFVAYIVARKNLRRQFTLSGKANPVDELAQALLDQLGPSSDWMAVAMAWPQAAAVRHLSSAQLAALSTRWMKVMRSCATTLKAEWRKLEGNLDRRRMIVRSGMNSSLWNETAQAYNTARAAWLTCVSAAAGGSRLLELMLPGKVMRLMAADLAWWHSGVGGGVDPNTEVWARLPLPWDVLAGDLPCSASLVREHCAELGLDSDRIGWTAPLPVGEAAAMKPTPELVHGVAVFDPVWAQAMRRAGVFSGRGGRKVASDAADLRMGADGYGLLAQELPSLDVILLGQAAQASGS
jgi:hypothetical protein